jgi:hypothetical protein
VNVCGSVDDFIGSRKYFSFVNGCGSVDGFIRSWKYFSFVNGCGSVDDFIGSWKYFSFVNGCGSVDGFIGSWRYFSFVNGCGSVDGFIGSVLRWGLNMFDYNVLDGIPLWCTNSRDEVQIASHNLRFYNFLLLSTCLGFWESLRRAIKNIQEERQIKYNLHGAQFYPARAYLF